jgi:hypothetical protein
MPKRKASGTDESVSKKQKGICQDDICVKKASYGVFGQTAQFCKEHSQLGMLNVITKKCEFRSCVISASYGFLGFPKRFCATHKAEGMVNIGAKLCENTDCCTIANFAMKGERPRFCDVHKTTGMINIVNLKLLCQVKDCMVRGTYQYPGHKERFCAKHKQDDMVDLYKKTCEDKHCDKTPTFGLPDGEPQYCKAHKLDGMIDLTHKPCDVDGCFTRPNFGYVGGVPIRCLTHKSDEMIALAVRLCEHLNCKTQPVYGYLGKAAQRCFQHKLDDMIDVNNFKKICSNETCKTRSRYGYPGTSPSVCAQHKVDGMIIKSNKQCDIKDCKELALFGTKTTQLHCEKHAVEGEINLVERRCVKCGFLNVVNPAYGQCGDCDKFFNQSKPVKKKELIIKGFLAHHGIQFTHDRVLEDACGNRERPDFVIDRGTFLIIVEVDEDQHSTYQCARTCVCPDPWHRHCKCQQARMVELTQLAQRPCVWLRYNPDKYNGPKMSAAKRQEDLLRHIKYYQAKETLDKEMEVVYLFYDEE